MQRLPKRSASTVRFVHREEPRRSRSLARPVAVAVMLLTLAMAGRVVWTSASGVAPGGSAHPAVGVSSTPRSEVSDGDAPRPSRIAPSAIELPAALAPAPVLVSATTSPEPAPPLPACRYADEPAAHTDYADWQRTIVDTINRLPKGHVPPDLVPVSRAGLKGGGSIRLIAIADLRALTKAARKAGVRLAVESAYRSEARQRGTFAAWVATAGAAEARRFSAGAGHSEHQLGTAIDFKAAGGGSPWTPKFARSRHARWLSTNAWRFGWILSYPAGAQAETCYGAEAWHYRYVGRDAAAEVHASGTTLRAWLWRHATAG